MSMNVYLSVGRAYTPAQEQFVGEFEQHLRARGLTPQTVGRNYFKNREPLRTISDCMRECQGAVILAFERIHIASGVEMRGGPDQAPMNGVNLPTVWNQIESAMAYTLGRPLLVVVEPGLRSEGLLQHGYDWYVVSAPLNQSLFSSTAFTGVLSDFKELLAQPRPAPEVDLGSLSVGQLLARLKPAQLWATLVAVVGIVAAAAALAYRLGAMNGGPL
jgi:hypothetical protein